MSNFYELDVSSWAKFHGTVYFGPEGAPTLVLPDDFATLASAGASATAAVGVLTGQVVFLTNAASTASTQIATLTGQMASASTASASTAARTNAMWNRMPAGSAALVASPLPVADISPKSAIVLLSALLGRVDQITDSLVAAGYMRYVP